ncbi:hypothetical protein [Aquimarina algiphila]|uniref:Uncharacterized protein n=1 Tax=Aquimarina algiphila TaxID=2047982 RepID=A0A554VRM2_9FLAO|nr:hypothetical protein [Aquimarina algiphila]TSE11295.1 hypothetical protein FOF46_01305 [Aquimarina algiphila]
MKNDPNHIITYAFLGCIIVGVLLAFIGGITHDGMPENDKLRIDYLITTMLGYLIGKNANEK